MCASRFRPGRIGDRFAASQEVAFGIGEFQTGIARDGYTGRHRSTNAAPKKESEMIDQPVSVKRGRLRWKKNTPPKGLGRDGPIGSKLTDGVCVYASVYARKRRPSDRGWYWVAMTSEKVTYKNTCDEPCETESEAKAQAEAYVRAQLNKEPA